MGSRYRFVWALVCALTLVSCSKKSTIPISSNRGNVESDVLALSVGSAAFGEITIGSASMARVVSLSNRGANDISFLQAPYFSGTDGSFVLDQGFGSPSANASCGLILRAGASCDVAIQFIPARAQAYAERLIFLYGVNSAQFVRELPVSGAGLAPPATESAALVVSPSSNGTVDFDFSRLLPDYVKTVNLTVTNPNITSAITVVDIDLVTETLFRQGASPAPCSATIAPSGNCQITIHFSSPAPIQASDLLRISYTVGSGSVRVAEINLRGQVSEPLRQRMHRFSKDGRYRHSPASDIPAIQSEGWEDLGAKFEVFAEPAKDSIPIYVVVNEGAIQLSANGTLQRGNMYPIGSSRPGAIIHHLKSPSGEHVYTTTDALKSKLISNGWTAQPAFGLAAAAIPGDDIAITPVPDTPVGEPEPQTAQPVNLVRWFNPAAKRHFHAMSGVTPPGSGWEVEGPVFDVFNDRAPGTVPWYHLRIGSSSTHYLTTNPAEKDALIANGGWSLFRIEGYIYPQQPSGVASTKIYHLYNPDIGDRAYTTDPAKRDFLVLRGWLLQDGNSGWSPSVAAKSNDPLRISPSAPQLDMYRVGYANAQGVITAHLFTASQLEYNAVIQPDNGSNGGGGTGEGAHFRVYATQQPDTLPIYRLNIPQTRVYHMTTNAAEKDYLASIGWTVFPVTHGFIYSSGSRGGYKVFYLYNPSTGDRIYTTNTALIQTLVPLGWREDGVLGWAPVP